MSATSWQTGFVAMSNLVGEPVERIREAIGEESLDISARSLLKHLSASERQTRAKALAAALTNIAHDLELLRYPWPSRADD